MTSLVYLIDLLSISFISSVVACVWVYILTTPQGLLGRIPNLYSDTILNKPLSCESCLSGWLCIGYYLSFLIYSFFATKNGFSDYYSLICFFISGLTKSALGGFFGIYVAAQLGKTLN